MLRNVTDESVTCALKMEAVSSCETSITIYRTTGVTFQKTVDTIVRLWDPQVSNQERLVGTGCDSTSGFADDAIHWAKMQIPNQGESDWLDMQLVWKMRYAYRGMVEHQTVMEL